MSKALSSISEKSVMKATHSRSRKGCMRRRGGPDNASCKFKGVRQRTWGKWVSEIRELNRGKRIWIGTFEDSESAAKAYDEAAIKLFGANAKLNFPERLLQVSCPVHDTAATSKDTLIDGNELKIPEEGIIEAQQGEYPPAMAQDKTASRLFGAYAKLNIPESLPQGSCPVHATAATSKDALTISKGIKIPEEGIIEMEQAGYPLAPIVDYDKFQGDNVGKNEANLEERRDNIKEKLILELPEFDDSSLWDEVMATTDFEKIENPKDFSAGNFDDDIFKDFSEDDLGLGNFWL